MPDAALISLGRSILRPVDDADPVAWCESNVLAIPDSPLPGPFRAERTPWIGEALRIASDPETRLVTILASIQSGKTLFARLLSCLIAARHPGPTLILQDNDQNARDFNLTALRPLWENCPAVASRLKPEMERSSTISFDRMTLWCLGAHNEKNLQRRSIQWLIGDECWLWPKGHLGEASARVTAFGWMGKRIFMSQGGIEGDDFDVLHRSTDQRDWNFCCPSCQKLQPWLWEQVRFPEEARTSSGWNKAKVASGTTYECAHCQTRLADNQGVRFEANSRGAFVATSVAPQSGHIGLHWNSLAAMSWGELGVMMLEAAEAYDTYGDEAPRRIFKQKRLALPWSIEGGTMVADATASDYKLSDVWPDEALLSSKGKMLKPEDDRAGSIPIRTMGVDVQKGHFWAVVRSWSSTGASRLRYFGKVSTWQDLDALAKAHNVHPAFVFVDSGDQTQLVYAQAAKRDWKVTKGSGQDDFNVKGGKRAYSDVQAISVPGSMKPARLIVFSALAMKDILHGLRLRKLHTFGMDTPPDYKEQIESEVRVRDRRTGKPMWILPQGKKDNHALDCEVLAMLAAMRSGVVGRDKSETQDEPLQSVSDASQ